MAVNDLAVNICSCQGHVRVSKESHNIIGKLNKICSKLGGGVDITIDPGLKICEHMLKARSCCVDVQALDTSQLSAT